MTSLFLLRHAKAVHAEPAMRDFDRPLHPRGKEECAFLVKEMRARKITPSHVLCSASRRTRETLDFVRPALAAHVPVTLSEELFSADADGYLEFIRQFGDAAGLLVIGHNPCVEEIAISLAARGDRAAIDTLMRGFQTGAMAHFEFEGPLSGLQRRNATLAAFIALPRN